MRVLTGIQSSGKPHLGNILGSILPSIELSHSNDSLFFVADLHSLTTIKDRQIIQNTYSVAAAWLAFGLTKPLFRQSDIPSVTELYWYLCCNTPYPMLSNAHAFKEKNDNLSNINAGIFSYPVLMAADILLYDSDVVPIGKDQVQHLEITRDIAKAFNKTYGEIFTIPKAKVFDTTVVGTDGRKMSKSYGNTIDVLADDKTIKKAVYSIVTDSKGVEEPKDADTCNIFKIYSLIAGANDTEAMREKYLSGYGYGMAKKDLYELIVEKFKKERENYNEYMNNIDYIENVFKSGYVIANEIAGKKMQMIRKTIFGK